MSGWNVYNGLVREWSVTPSLSLPMNHLRFTLYIHPHSMPLCLRVLRARNRAQWARLFGPRDRWKSAVVSIRFLLLLKPSLLFDGCVSRLFFVALQRCKIADEKNFLKYIKVS